MTTTPWIGRSTNGMTTSVVILYFRKVDAMYTIVEKLIPVNGYTRPGKKLVAVRGVVIHWTANERRGADAQAHYRFFSQAKVKASAHYFVDDKTILRIIPEDEMAYHVGAKQYKTNQFGSYPNNCLIGVEMCVNADGNFAETYKRAVWLVADILKRYNLNPDTCLVRHFDVTGKDCPRMFVNDAAAQKYMGMTAEAAWQKFRSDVKTLFHSTSKTSDIPTPAASPQSNDKPLLKRGSKGEAVKTLQSLLNQLGYSVGAVDGIFGPATENGVKRFQASCGLVADGIVGPKTWAALERAKAQPSSKPVIERPTVRRGSRGRTVEYLQQLLRKHGFVLAVDGIFGPATEKAVIEFQKKKGLVADGIVGPKTWAALEG